MKVESRVLVCIHGVEFVGVIVRIVDGVYWFRCVDCGKTHLALEEEIVEVLEHDSVRG